MHYANVSQSDEADQKAIEGEGGQGKASELHRILEELPNYRSGCCNSQVTLTEKSNNSKSGQRCNTRTLWLLRRRALSDGPGMHPTRENLHYSRALSRRQIKLPLSTLRPTGDCGGLWIQLVEIHWHNRGSNRGARRRASLTQRGSERRCLMIAHDLTADPQELNIILTELSKTKLPQPLLIVYTKMDDPSAENRLRAVQTRFAQFKSVAVSARTELAP